MLFISKCQFFLVGVCLFVLFYFTTQLSAQLKPVRSFYHVSFWNAMPPPAMVHHFSKQCQGTSVCRNQCPVHSKPFCMYSNKTTWFSSLSLALSGTPSCAQNFYYSACNAQAVFRFLMERNRNPAAMLWFSCDVYFLELIFVAVCDLWISLKKQVSNYAAFGPHLRRVSSIVRVCRGFTTLQYTYWTTQPSRVLVSSWISEGQVALPYYFRVHNRSMRFPSSLVIQMHEKVLRLFTITEWLAFWGWLIRNQNYVSHISHMVSDNMTKVVFWGAWLLSSGWCGLRDAVELAFLLSVRSLSCVKWTWFAIWMNSSCRCLSFAKIN